MPPGHWVSAITKSLDTNSHSQARLCPHHRLFNLHKSCTLQCMPGNSNVRHMLWPETKRKPVEVHCSKRPGVRYRAVPVPVSAGMEGRAALRL